jgi:uncharacterized membrane protein YjjP (DUF1212 family)
VPDEGAHESAREADGDGARGHDEAAVPPERPSTAESVSGRLPWMPPAVAGQTWQDRQRARLRGKVPALEPATERSATKVSVPRVLDLALRSGELLLASGEGGEDVEAAMLAITSAYGLERCEPNLTFVSLTISYQPSLVEAPITGERVVRRRSVDYNRLAATHRLIDDIVSAELSLEEAYHRLAEIRRNRHPYPGWLVRAAAGGVAASASVLVGGGPLVAVIAFVAAVVGDRLAAALAARGVPEFYQFVLAAMPAAIAAAIVQWLDLDIVEYAVVTGGLFALVPGRAVVAAVQDGLTGFYITASARLLEVAYLIIAIIAGISLVLYVSGRAFGIEFSAEGTFAPSSRPPVQMPAAAALSVTFAMLVQVRPGLLAVAAAGGAVSWSVFAVLRDAGAAPVLATVTATTVVGLLGQLLARARRTSSLPYVIPAIGPLLPGSALYQGMLGITVGHTSTGWTSMLNAGALALALAVGVNIGSEAARFVLPVPAAGRVRRPAAKRTGGF